MRRPSGLLHRTFLAGVVVKGLDGILEILGGTLLLLTSRSELLHWVHALTRHELLEDPHDFVANLLLHALRHTGVQTRESAAIYLLVHGVIKAGLVAGLLEGALWSFPAALFFLTTFVGYQIYRLTQTGSLLLAGLTLLDLAIIALIWLEWRHHCGRRPCEPADGSGS